MRKIAFTLAEVLIVLGIIGVVAAMTIPTLIAKQRKQVAEVKVEKFYSMMTQAIKLSEAENGPASTWDYGSSTDHRNTKILENWYNTYLAPYIKNAGEYKVQSTTSDGGGNGVFIVNLADGGALRIDALPGNYAIIGYYLSAELAKNEIVSPLQHAINGKNYFVFLFWNGKFTANIYPSQTDILLKESCSTHLKDANWEGCTAILMRNGWKFPYDYPVKF